MAIDRKDAIHNGNASLVMGLALGLNALSCPCPPCVLGTIGLMLNGIRQKLGIRLFKRG